MFVRVTDLRVQRDCDRHAASGNRRWIGTRIGGGWSGGRVMDCDWKCSQTIDRNPPPAPYITPQTDIAGVIRSVHRIWMHFGAVGRAKRVDFGTQDWYTRLVRANDKPLILLHSLKLRGNPSLRSELRQTLVVAGL